MPERAISDEKFRDTFTDMRRFWGRKWYNYLAIGNGGALLACASVLLQNNANSKLLVPSAWWFFTGLIAASVLPKLRFMSASYTWKYLLWGRNRPILHGLKPMRRGSANFWKSRVVGVITAVFELTSALSFFVGIWAALAKLSVA